MHTMRMILIALAAFGFLGLPASAVTVTKDFRAVVTDSTPPAYALGDIFDLSFSFDDAAAPVDGVLSIPDADIGVAIGGVDPLFGNVGVLDLDVTFADGAISDFDLLFIGILGAVNVNTITATIAGATFSGEFFGAGDELIFAQASTGAFTEVGAIPLPAPLLLLTCALLALGVVSRRRRVS